MADHERDPDRSPASEPAGGGGGRFDAAALQSLLGAATHRYLLTAAFEGARSGVRVLSVQVCATEPVLLCVAARKGHVVEPLIRDSHAFGLCLIDESDRLTLRKFPVDDPGGEDDPFDSLSVGTLRTGSPLLSRSVVALDCEVVRHFDLEADHELYIGVVVEARTGSPAAGSSSKP